ncbi:MULTISPECIES: HesB/YadR/YfhF family protein [Sporosarcina]|uniref:HesB/YadR/YfhF family protein n=1 Tax=Sporosarcina TaxID=1569 RepID=UPI000C16DE94|nr:MULTISPECIES: HesB/YadR/YfhF family protein [Sporosarcina]PIC56869.1 hypothetical protein CSV81_12015 [Sporosarcina sp. P10]PIC60264.1 hypothetical protein CSV80_11650 [Sporosarcina sp. P12(2017)]PIC77482.1 hypothetical protein CSV74_05165 [Sporosarcina sp. P19]
MNIHLSEQAIQWFEEDMEVAAGDYVKFFARYGGSSPLHEGFSIGITKEEPDELAVETIVNDVHYYVEERDVWFFDGHDLHIDVDTSTEELSFDYQVA